jgi:leader peptidase (prepilin peptidase) / N-methyltransferase
MTSWLGSSIMLPWLVCIIGLCLGSFLNVVIYRLPRGESVVVGRSHCPACSTLIKPWFNVPVLGYLMLRGKCRDCGVSISPRYPMVEMLTSALVLLAAGYSADFTEFAVKSVIIMAMIVITFIDLDHRIIPDAITLPGILLGLMVCPWLGVGRIDAVIGVAAGAGFFLMIHYIYKAVRGISGMGGGDIKMAAMLGAWLGWPGVLLTILFGSFLGTIAGTAVIAAGRGHGRTALPYGTFLAPAAVVVVLYGRSIWSWYLALGSV